MQIFDFFPTHIVKILNRYINLKIEEIRFRVGQPIIIKETNTDIVLDYKTTCNDILDILQKICENSIYSYQNQICNA